MQIPIRRTIERIPGGMMLVPLACGALLHTFAPRAPSFFGSFTGALFLGALPILAVFYVCIGSTIAVAALPQVVRRGGALLATKIALGIAAGLFLGHFLGARPATAGWFAGLSTLAVVAAINDTNGGLYMALMNQYGTPEDTASYSIMALESGPFLTMVTLGVAGLASFPWPTLAGAILPLLIGLALGNLDPDLRRFLGSAVPVLIPFFAFALGATLDLRQVWGAGLTGIGLGVVILFVSALALGFVDRLIGGTGLAGIAAATTAGNAAAVPALIAAADRHYAAAAAPATVLVASSVMVTTILAPVLTAWWDLHLRRAPARRFRSAPPRLLILADDLTGAADSALACAGCGLPALVLLDADVPHPAEPVCPVVAIDADTRCRAPEEAARTMARLAASAPDRILFKKIDSTLRGHLAPELASLLEARRRFLRRPVVALFAPAFPAHRRATVSGRLLVDGLPLDSSGFRSHESAPGSASIADLLAGLRCAPIELPLLRSGRAPLERALLHAARSADVLICDAETDADLAALSSAALLLGPAAVWVGSAGLACHLPRAARWTTVPIDATAFGLTHPAHSAPAHGGSSHSAQAPTLFLVGSRASRLQAEELAASPGVLTLRLSPALLLAGAWHEEQQLLHHALATGADTLVLIDEAPALVAASRAESQAPGQRTPGQAVAELGLAEQGTALAAALARFVAPASASAGALVATGGQTARAVLDAWGIRRLRLAGQIEPGLPLSIAEDWQRPLPILTKAGGFGSPQTLVNCRHSLRQPERRLAGA